MKNPETLFRPPKLVRVPRRACLGGKLALAVFAILVPLVANAGKITTLYAFGDKPESLRAGLVRASDGNYYGVSQTGGVYKMGTVFKLTPAGALQTIHSFGPGVIQGVQPQSALTEGADGMLYGSTGTGGIHGHGTLFKISRSGVFTSLHSFLGEDGDDPTRLVPGTDGNLYGTTRGPYSSTHVASGTIFRISPGGVFTRLYQFSRGVYGGYGADGGYPGPLTRGSDGNFYGNTHRGGTTGAGTFFRISESGILTIVHHYQSGSGAATELVEGPDGSFYGTVASGGASVYYGFINRITKDGVVTKLYDFTGGEDGSASDESYSPRDSATLVFGTDGNLYGTSPLGGTGATPGGHRGYGIVFRLTPAGVFEILHSFTGGADGRKPKNGLVPTGGGAFRGITTGGGGFNQPAGTIFDIAPDGSFATVITLPPLYTNNGDDPLGELVEGGDGNFYGATRGGGVHDMGTIFRMEPSGAVTTLHEFSGKPDGRWPGELCLGSDGNLYGTAYIGGEADFGTIFRITPAGVFTLLYSFDSGEGTGYPVAGLIRGAEGELFGTTRGYGDSGTIFRITTAGAFSVVHHFSGALDGSEPDARLVRTSDGTLFGTTSFSGPKGGGTVFRRNPSGQLETLYSFPYARAPEGSDPQGLVLAQDGNLYGFTATELGDKLSTLFRLSLDGVLTTLQTFPEGLVALSLLEAADGHLYGVVTIDSTAPPDPVPPGGHGFVFRLTTSGSFQSVHDFTGGGDGKWPTGLMQATDGTFYGATASGPGRSDLGTLFKLGLGSDLSNISTRLRVQTGERVLIGGFVIAGSAPKKVVIRALGPSLPGVGAGDVLADPTLELRAADGSLISSNNNWKDTHETEVRATTIPPANDLESAIVATLLPGAYTAVVQGNGGSTGVGLMEVYDLTPNGDSELVNISTRGFVQAGDNVMIGGVIVGGGAGRGSARVVVRALGPSLSGAGIQGALPDTTLALHSGNGAMIAFNDNWKDSQQSEIELTTIPPANDLESALVSTLVPGNYTAIVRGKGSETGVGLVEAYNLR